VFSRAGPYSGRGESYLKTRDYDQAIADFTRVIDSTDIISKDVGEVLACRSAPT
jgi:hypothetical protein